MKNRLMPTDRWDDPFENFFLKCKGVTKDGHSVSAKNFTTVGSGSARRYDPESDAMWRIYSKKKNGVRVSTTIRKTFRDLRFTTGPKHLCCSQFAVGRISYKPRAEIETILASVSFAQLTMGGQ